ncbi:hypothetical protein THAOC_34648, partial [Thalassiosira oceanica]
VDHRDGYHPVRDDHGRDVDCPIVHGYFTVCVNLFLEPGDGGISMPFRPSFGVGEDEDILGGAVPDQCRRPRPELAVLELRVSRVPESTKNAKKITRARVRLPPAGAGAEAEGNRSRAYNTLRYHRRSPSVAKTGATDLCIIHLYVLLYIYIPTQKIRNKEGRQKPLRRHLSWLHTSKAVSDALDCLDGVMNGMRLKLKLAYAT